MAIEVDVDGGWVATILERDETIARLEKEVKRLEESWDIAADGLHIATDGLQRGTRVNDDLRAKLATAREALADLIHACTPAPATTEEVSGRAVPHGVRMPDRREVEDARAALAAIREREYD